MTSIAARAALAAAEIENLLATPREERVPGYAPVAQHLPEIAEAREALAGTRLELRSARMADGSGFAEIRHTITYGVVLSSERYPDAETNREARLAALASVARRFLDGELDA